MKKLLIPIITTVVALIGFTGVSTVVFATTTATASSTQSGTSFNNSLSYGLRNNADVANLQQFLIAQGFLKMSAPTGNYFSVTRTAVAAFQKAQGISATGYFGPLTMAAANKELAVVAAAPAATVAVQSVKRSDTSMTATLISFLTSTPANHTITWQTNRYPLNAGVNINLVKKTSDSPVSYNLVRQLGTNVPNTGTFSWLPKSGETSSGFYVEVTCASITSSPSACQISADPIQVQ